MTGGFGAGATTVLVAAVLLVLSAGTVGGVFDGEASNSGELPTAGETALRQSVEPDNNTTIHEDPSVVGETGDLEAVEQHLARSLTRRLGESTLHLSQGEYDIAKRFVGEEYRQEYGQYVDVAGQTDDESGDGQRDRFERARENQREYVSSVERYRETYREYREARRNGNESRARELARELERLSRRVDSTGSALEQNYRTVSRRTNQSLSESRQTVENVTQNVTGQQATVREETFVRTSLSLRASSTDISFLDPLTLTGEVVDANGTAIANRSAGFRIGDQTLQTETNASGGFELTYRPTTLPVNASELTVAYVPENQSVYLGSNATVAVNVTQVQPTVRIADAPERTAFNETLAVSGSVGANGTGAGGVPVVLSVDGHRLGSGTTESNGSFTLRATVPATIPAGERSLKVTVPLQDQALDEANGTTPLTLGETGTSLNISAESTGETVQVNGRLVAADGVPVREQPVEIRAGGETLAIARTDATGRYETTTSVPSSVTGGDDEQVNVVAVYGASRTNLAPSRAETAVALPTTGSNRQGLLAGRFIRTLMSLPWWALTAGGLALSAVGGIVGRRLYRRRGASTPASSDVGTGSVSGSATTVETTEAPDRVETLLEAARSSLERGRTEDAVRSAYAAARSALSDDFRIEPGSTHWEVFRTCIGIGLEGDRRQALERLTRTYERAAFASGGVETNQASTALEDASVLVGRADR